MTAQKYLSTRAVAVYETWGRELPGRIAFFSSDVSDVPENRKDLPLIRLRNVDDSYPPQKKSFMMLQYMWENYGNYCKITRKKYSHANRFKKLQVISLILSLSHLYASFDGLKCGKLKVLTF